ncbi:ATP-dependent DNA helicase [Caerostris extrusa]|uniref:ATP-dependent DNA helicase n=1 Tax=Caerostris extrusa TaxID=172846 RepID=A0AAV4UBQ8_CAEEX|nr:ATP-dependent DNA helicase [Caerostris extrusa]
MVYILNDYYPPAPAKEDDPLTKELKRLESTASDPIFAFLHKREENYSYHFMYHNIQSLPAHHEDLSSDQSFMHSDLLLLAETWTIRSDRFEFQDFKLCVETHPSLNHTRKSLTAYVFMPKKILIFKELERFQILKRVCTLQLYTSKQYSFCRAICQARYDG